MVHTPHCLLMRNPISTCRPMAAQPMVYHCKEGRNKPTSPAELCILYYVPVHRFHRVGKLIVEAGSGSIPPPPPPCSSDDIRPPITKDNHDTIGESNLINLCCSFNVCVCVCVCVWIYHPGMIVVDAKGNIGCGTSTNGATHKIAG